MKYFLTVRLPCYAPYSAVWNATLVWSHLHRFWIIIEIPLEDCWQAALKTRSFSYSRHIQLKTCFFLCSEEKYKRKSSFTTMRRGSRVWIDEMWILTLVVKQKYRKYALKTWIKWMNCKIWAIKMHREVFCSLYVSVWHFQSCLRHSVYENILSFHFNGL